MRLRSRWPSALMETLLDPEDDTHDQSLHLGGCEVCGERGPCSYDPEGLPLIHLTTIEHEED